MPDDDDLFDAPRPKKASGRTVFQPAGAQWSLDRLPEVQSAYQTAFKKNLPLANKGQGSIHNKWGYDHRNSADVSLNPSTPEGQQFTQKLREMNVPFLAFNQAIPGVATGPHIHIGFPSHRTTQKFNVGTQRKEAATASDDLFDNPKQSTQPATVVADDDLFDSASQAQSTAAPTKEKTPQVTSTVKDDVGEDLTPSVTPAVTKPLPFQESGTQRPTSLNPIEAVSDILTAKKSQQATGLARLQSEHLKTPKSQDAGERVKIPFKAGASPTSDEVVQGFLSVFGPEYGELGKRYKAETGQNILSLTDTQFQREPDGSYYVRPSRGAIDYINAYGQGGLKAADDEANKQKQEYAESQNRAIEESKPDIKAAEAAAQRGVESPTVRGLASGAAKSAQVINTLGGSAVEKLGFGDKARVMRAAAEEADKRAPLKKGSLDQLKAGLGEAIPTAMMFAATGPLGAAQLPTLGAAEGFTPEERIQGGLQGAATQATFGLGPHLAPNITGLSQKALTASTLAGIPVGEALAKGEDPLRALAGSLPYVALPFLHKGSEPESVSDRPLGLDRFQHLQFGEVHAAENQSGVGQGRGRVVDESGTEHVIQKPNARGAGNERAIPLKPAEAQPADVPLDTAGEAVMQTASMPIEPSVREGEKPDVEIAAETNEDLAARANVGRERDAAMQARSEAARRVAQSLESGDTVVMGDGTRITVTHHDKRNETVTFIGEDGNEAVLSTKDMAAEFIPQGVTLPNGERGESKPATIERAQPSPQVEAVKPEVNVPEKPATIDAQLDARGYSLIPNDNPRPPLPRGYRVQKTADGVVYYDPRRIDAETIKNTPITELLGHVEPKSTETTETVVARKPDGTEIQSSAVSPENVERQAEVTQANFPDAKIETGGSDLAQEVINERQGVPVKTAAIESEREAAGLNPIEKQQYRNIGESFLAGKKAVEDGKLDPRMIAAEVAKTPRSLTDEETGALGYDRARLRNDYDSKIAELNKAIDAKNPEAVASTRAQLEEIERLADENDAALEKGGREQSIAFNARKMLVGRDYSLLGTTQRVKAAKGSELTPVERGRIETLTKQLAEAEKTIANYESTKSGRGLKRLISETERELRKQGRTASRQLLDTEFAQLSQQFRAKMSGVQPAAIDPTLIPIIAKMARNRVQAGFNTVEGLVDELHSQLKVHIDDKRAIRDAFSGYGQEPKLRTRDDITAELGKLKQEAKRLSKAEDRNPVTEAAKQEAAKQKTIKTRLSKQIADLEGQLKTGDFTKTVRPKLEYDKEAEHLLAHRDLLKDRIEREIAKQKKPLPEDYLSWWQQGTILSGTRTLAKLGSYALGKNVVIPIEDVISGAMSHVPSLRGLSRASPRYGGGIRENIEAQGAAFKEFVHKAMYRDAWTSLKEGTNALKLKHGDGKYQHSPRLLTFIRGLHMAEKVFASRPEYYRAVEKETKWAVRQGLDPQNPKVQSEILARSYMNGLRAQLMQPNIPSKLLSTANAWLESVGKTGKIGQLQEPGIGATARAARLGLRTLFPITRVPFNYVNEALTYNPVGGALKGGGRMGVEAYKTLRSKGIGRGVIDLVQQGMSNMSPQAADATKRALVKGSLGIPFALIGWYNYQNIGGYYQPGQRKEGDVPFGGLRIGGYDIPRALVHNPLFETMHFFATMRRVYEGKKEGGDYTHAAGEALQGSVEETPFLDVPQRIGKALENKSGVQKMAGEIARSAVVPPDVQRVAAVSDQIEPTTLGQKALQVAGLRETKAVKRKPEGFVDTFKMGVPGLRQTIPISNVFGSQKSKATDEAQRLNLKVEGAIRQPDEAPEDFKVRQQVQNTTLRELMSEAVNDPLYDKLSDKEKKKWWGDESEFAAQYTKDHTPEKKKNGENEVREFPTLIEQTPTGFRNLGFNRAYPDQALSIYEKMKPSRRAEVYDNMTEKAWLLTHSPTLSDEQKADFKARLDKLNIVPRPPNTPKQSIGQQYKSSIPATQ